MSTPEGIVEDYFKRQTEHAGALPMKFKSPSKRGVPDQIVLFNGNSYYVELKAPKKKPRKSQLQVHEEFKQHGIPVYIIDSKKDVDSFVETVLNVTIEKEIYDKSAETMNLNHSAFSLH